MTDDEMLLGRIDERTKSIQADVTEIKASVAIVCVKLDNQEKRLTIVETEQKGIKDQMGVSPPALNRKTIATIGGTGGLIGALITLLGELLLKRGG